MKSHIKDTKAHPSPTHILNRDRSNVFTTSGDYELFDAASNVQVAILIKTTNVTRVQPTISINRFFGLVVAEQVAKEGLRQVTHVGGRSKTLTP